VCSCIINICKYIIMHMRAYALFYFLIIIKNKAYYYCTGTNIIIYYRRFDKSVQTYNEKKMFSYLFSVCRRAGNCRAALFFEGGGTERQKLVRACVRSCMCVCVSVCMSVSV